MRGQWGQEERAMTAQIRKLWHDEGGLTSIEYALLLSLIVLAGLVAWRGLGGTVSNSAGTSAELVANADEG